MAAMTDTSKNEMIERLEAMIAERRSGDAATSYVAKMAAKGREALAKKVGEEGVELALASVLNEQGAATAEAADLVFHMLMLLADMEIPFADVLAELERREGRSGIEEKNSRKD